MGQNQPERIALFVVQCILFGLVGWRVMQDNDRWWARYEKRMLARGKHVERTAEWEKQTDRQRNALTIVLIIGVLGSLRFWLG